ncbi:malate synthase A [Candidatus Enterovibrio altilux]|uniref:malate synthase n=1 Tax=Candidatus Enterovibrio altilux TaxID=1927128 RepID=A0A291BAB2_9GAMM|nr:malate synthase A [Candidatus Enterovibrio luxaltus]ATF09946.1 Malate synthase [Candidatus Enterovibrio luxaltus]
MVVQTQYTFKGLMFVPPVTVRESDVLTAEAMTFIDALVTRFADHIPSLLEARDVRQAYFDSGELPDFLSDTSNIRDSDWTILGIPSDLQDRRLEITGPPKRKMIINALNANVKIFMADFEDSFSPEWKSVLDGQRNLMDAINGTISYKNLTNGKKYTLNDDPAVLMCRVRGLHLKEKHILYNGKAIPGALFDFGVYFFHNHKTLLANGSGPYFYLPKLQGHKEAAWWSDVFYFTEDQFNLPHGTIKVTVLIETLPAVFEMDEILFKLKDHIVALNCGRWDYIFSYIKTLKNHPDRILPDREVVTMDKPFLNAYSRLLISTCHRRGAMALGGMTAFIPSKDPEKNTQVLDKLQTDKLLEANTGYDGTWVAHPGLVNTAKAVFDAALGDRKNQLDVMREQDSPITANELLAPCEGDRTEDGMRHNIRVTVQYIEAWLSGNGCVPIYGLMEDAATAEIARASIWQWIRHEQSLSNGKKMTTHFFRACLTEEMGALKAELGNDVFKNGKYQQAASMLEQLTTSNVLADFLTLSGYEWLD